MDNPPRTEHSLRKESNAHFASLRSLVLRHPIVASFLLARLLLLRLPSHPNSRSLKPRGFDPSTRVFVRAVRRARPRLGPSDSIVQTVVVRSAARGREVGHSRRCANQVGLLCATFVAVEFLTQAQRQTRLKVHVRQVQELQGLSAILRAW